MGSKDKGLALPGDGSLEALTAHVEMAAPANLTAFLSGFQYTAPALTGDMAAIERIAVEFCEDAAYNGLLYVESRFCPNFLVGDSASLSSDDVVEEAQLAKCNVNAIKASFLPEGEKELMVKRLFAAYGLDST